MNASDFGDQRTLVGGSNRPITSRLFAPVSETLAAKSVTRPPRSVLLMSRYRPSGETRSKGLSSKNATSLSLWAGVSSGDAGALQTVLQTKKADAPSFRNNLCDIRSLSDEALGAAMGGKRTLVFAVECVPSIVRLQQLVHRRRRNLLGLKRHGG